MTHRVLIITGGLITSQEKSLWRAARKCAIQFSAAEHAWLDLKIKLATAEPLVAGAMAKATWFSQPAPVKAAHRNYFSAPPAAETSSLTEVVLCTLLNRAGIEYETINLELLFDDPSQAEEALRRATCVFLSTTYLHDLSELGAAVQRIKRPHLKIVAGGALVGVIHDQCEGAPGVDIFAVGYGEYLVAPLADWLRSGCQQLSPPQYGRVQKKQHSTFIYSGVPETRSLDDLITPDWSLAATPSDTVFYESVRGCPYRCSFCNYPFLFDDQVFRYKSAEKMAADWRHYVEALGAKYITCLDSLFTIPRDRLRRFCELLQQQQTSVKWTCYARADDLADENTVVMMKQAGAHQVQIGIESGDPQQLKNMNKACSVSANALALDHCRKHGLTSVVSLIVGYPGETEGSLQRTYQFLQNHPPDFYFLATFSTRVAGVPLLSPQNRRKFGLQTAGNLHSMAPYWSHDTMSCTAAVNHVRALDRRLMQNEVALNAAMFYQGMLHYDDSQRSGLLAFQKQASRRRWISQAAFSAAHWWIDRQLRRDIDNVLTNQTVANPVNAGSSV